MVQSFLITIISSSVIATLLSSIINYYLKKVDFKHEYFKIVIKKRLAAYEDLEYLVASLKTSALDEIDQKGYHACFFSSQNFQEYSARLALANSNNLWLNSPIDVLLSKLNSIFNQIRFEFDIGDNQELIAAGKKYYMTIADLRVDIENQARIDILSLYDLSGINRKSTRKDLTVINISKRLIEKLKNR